MRGRANRVAERLAASANRSLRQFGIELFRGEPGALGYGTTQSRTLRNRALRGLARVGYGVRRTYGADVPPHLIDVVERVRPYTMTSQASVIGLCDAVEYLVRNQTAGAFVECGVWRGGSMMATALTLMRAGVTDRELYLFDTFAGMPIPAEVDTSLVEPEERPLERWRRDERDGHNEWAFAPREKVLANLLSTGYPSDRLHLVQGRVEDTIPDNAPPSIALLRLDTDWYSSTRHELEHLYPRLAPGGILILDDYGSWAGHRKAADEYEPLRSLLLCRLDAFARIAVKRG